MKRLIVLALLSLGIGLGVSLALLQFEKPLPADRSYNDPKVEGVAIGGSFELVDHHGKTVTHQSWPGQYLLLFFGFTHCPDICPLNLNIMTEALDSLPADLVAQIQPLMITIDPDRDTPDQMAEYMSLFHPKMIGLSGTQKQISVATKAYRVYEQKVLFEAADANPDDYTINHSSFTYLMAPSGELLDVFAHNTPPKDMATALKKYVRVR